MRGATAGRARAAGPRRWLARHRRRASRDGDVPADEQAALRARGRPIARPSPGAAPARPAVTAWRKAEAARRGVDPQVVLPGHCAAELVDALLAHADDGDAAALEAAIARIPGLGARRRERYAAAFLALAAQAPLS